MIMRDARGDYLLFIDSDMAWQPPDIARLIKSGKDIIGGLYYKRRFPYGPVVYGHDGLTHKQIEKVPERLFRCDGVGTGFLLISRKIINKFKEPELVADWGFPFDPLKSLQSGDAASYYNGEDLSFCLKARHLKLDIWCDPETLVGHVGTQVMKGPL
jgi:glycosyltransferase involved in cell wall biosynthesis